MKIKIATVCSGIGSPEQALKNMGIDHEISFACEIDNYARTTYLANFNPNEMYSDMTKEEWDQPEQYADIFIGGIPCQAFSMAGKRLGELDPRGLLFYDFYRYVKNQQPKVFIIENVKGFLSDNNGTTFQNWVQLLGRSMNTHLNMFNHEDSLLYNLHFKVLNSKDFGVPQNRERVFLVGIREDLPNSFRFPAGFRLTKRLKDILEPVVDEKYYLSEKAINSIILNPDNLQKSSINPEIANTLQAPGNSCGTYKGANYIQEEEPILKQIYQLEGFESEGRVYDADGLSRTIKNGGGGGAKTGWYAIENPAGCDQPVVVGVTTNNRIAGWFENENVIGAHMGDAKRSSVSEHIYHKETGICNTIQTAHTPKVIEEVVQLNQSTESNGVQPYQQNRVYADDGLMATLDLGSSRKSVLSNQRIRRLTPLECFRLQGYPDDFIKPCSDSQTYKQAGNSITTNVIGAILKNLLPILQHP